MSRSVTIPRDCIAVTYTSKTVEDWEEYTEELQDMALGLWPDLGSADMVIDEECVVLASDGQVLFGMSGYGSIIAIWLCWNNTEPDYDFFQVKPDLAEILEREFGTLRAVGSMGNGTTAYVPKPVETTRPLVPDTPDTL